jgi:WD40 repeat protein
VLTGAADGTARLWDAATGEAQGPPLSNPGTVVAAAFAPDGRAVATGSVLIQPATGKVVRSQTCLWDAEGRIIGRPLSHPGIVTALAFSPDGRLLLTGSGAPAKDGTGELSGEARLWDAATGEPAGPPLEHPRLIQAVAFSPDGRTFATGSVDRQARLWLTGPAAPLGPPLATKGAVETLTFSPDGRSLLAGSLCDRDGGYLWTVPQSPADPLPLRQEAAVQGLALAPDGRTLLTPARAGDRWGGRLWDLATGKPLRQFVGQGIVRGVALSPDGRLAATASEDTTVRLWDTTTGRPAATPLRNPDGVFHVVFRPDGHELLVSGGNFARHWHVEGRPRGEPVKLVGWCRGAAFSPDGRKVLAGDEVGVAWWDADSGRPVGRSQQSEGGIRSVAVARTAGPTPPAASGVWSNSGTRPPTSRPAPRCCTRARSAASPTATTAGPC